MTGARHWGDNGAQSRQNPAHLCATDEVVWEPDLRSPAFHFAKLGLKERNQSPLILINMHSSLEENGCFNLQQRGRALLLEDRFFLTTVLEPHHMQI